MSTSDTQCSALKETTSHGITPEQLTSMFPVGRMGRPEELVAAVRYLCSDDARYVTGSMLILDGGYTAQ